MALKQWTMAEVGWIWAVWMSSLKRRSASQCPGIALHGWHEAIISGANIAHHACLSPRLAQWNGATIGDYGNVYHVSLEVKLLHAQCLYV